MGEIKSEAKAAKLKGGQVKLQNTLFSNNFMEVPKSLQKETGPVKCIDDMIAEKEVNDLKDDKDKTKDASAVPVYAPQMKLTVYGNSPQKEEGRGQR